jgi:nicotinate-nucleotide adenylyltransferase
MRVALYFGSFNPVHNGHLIIAQHVAQSIDIDEVWFVVSPQNPFKNGQTLLHEQHRLNMVREAIEGCRGLRASNVEFSLPKPSYTINTLAYLKEKHPGITFCILLGSDGFQNINKWKNGEVIAAEYPIYIYKRPGFEVKIDNLPNCALLEAPLLNISSTHIRNLLRLGKSIRFLVPPSVEEAIEKNGYYLSALENPPQQ